MVGPLRAVSDAVGLTRTPAPPYKDPMFGFSLTKLIFTAAVIAFIWYGFKWVGRVQARREAEHRARLREGRLGEGRHGEGRHGEGQSRPEDGPAEAPVEETAHDMVKCSICGDFVSPEATQGCDRPGCPYSA